MGYLHHADPDPTALFRAIDDRRRQNQLDAESICPVCLKPIDHDYFRRKPEGLTHLDCIVGGEDD